MTNSRGDRRAGAKAKPIRDAVQGAVVGTVAPLIVGWLVFLRKASPSEWHDAYTVVCVVLGVGTVTGALAAVIAGHSCRARLSSRSGWWRVVLGFASVITASLIGLLVGLCWGLLLVVTGLAEAAGFVEFGGLFLGFASLFAGATGGAAAAMWVAGANALGARGEGIK